jgi:hypothetical protein
MEPKNSLKTQNCPGFHAQVWPGMAITVIFWTEKLILVIVFTQQTEINNYSLGVIIIIHWTFHRLNLRLPDPVHFNRPGRPGGPILNR